MFYLVLSDHTQCITHFHIKLFQRTYYFQNLVKDGGPSLTFIQAATIQRCETLAFRAPVAFAL